MSSSKKPTRKQIVNRLLTKALKASTKAMHDRTLAKKHFERANRISPQQVSPPQVPGTRHRSPKTHEEEATLERAKGEQLLRNVGTSLARNITDLKGMQNLLATKPKGDKEYKESLKLIPAVNNRIDTLTRQMEKLENFAAHELAVEALAKSEGPLAGVGPWRIHGYGPRLLTRIPEAADLGAEMASALAPAATHRRSPGEDYFVPSPLAESGVAMEEADALQLLESMAADPRLTTLRSRESGHGTRKKRRRKRKRRHKKKRTKRRKRRRHTRHKRRHKRHETRKRRRRRHH